MGSFTQRPKHHLAYLGVSCPFGPYLVGRPAERFTDRAPATGNRRLVSTWVRDRDFWPLPRVQGR